MIINILQILEKKLKSLILIFLNNVSVQLTTANFHQNVHKNQMNPYLPLLLKQMTLKK